MTYYLKLKSNYIMSTTALLYPNPSAIKQLSDAATERTNERPAEKETCRADQPDRVVQ